jgi:hypothetical protein
MSASDIAFDYPKVALGGGSPPQLPPLQRRWASPPHGKPEKATLPARRVLTQPSPLSRLVAKRYAWHRLRAELKTWRAEFATWQAAQAPQPDAEQVAAADRPRVARPWRASLDENGRVLQFEYVTGNEETES